MEAQAVFVPVLVGDGNICGLDTLGLAVNGASLSFFHFSFSVPSFNRLLFLCT